MTKFLTTHISIFDNEGTLILGANPNIDANKLAASVLNIISDLSNDNRSK